MATPWKPDPGRGWGPSQGQIPGLGSQTLDEAGVQVRGRFLALSRLGGSGSALVYVSGTVSSLPAGT